MKMTHKKCIVCFFHQLKKCPDNGCFYEILEGVHILKTSTSTIENDSETNMVLRWDVLLIIFISATIFCPSLDSLDNEGGKNASERKSLFEHYDFHSWFSKELKEV